MPTSCRKFVYAAVGGRFFYYYTMKYTDQLKNPKWQKKRLEIFQRDNFTCKMCGGTENTLHVHHTKYNTGKMAWEYDNSLLLTVCEDCHDVIELFKKEGIEVKKCCIIYTKHGNKGFFLCTSDKDVCYILQFKDSGYINGKELLIVIPYYVIDNIHTFFKTNNQNG